MRPNRIYSIGLPVPYCFYPEFRDGGWFVFPDRYISLGDTLQRELGGEFHEVIEVFGFDKEELNSNKLSRLNPTVIVHYQAIRLSGKCSPKVGENFYVNNLAMSY